MKLALDVYYPTSDSSIAVGILFNSWEDEEPVEIIRVKTVGKNAPYIPGKFSLRELPPIKSLLDEISNIVPEIDTYIVDGFVKLKGYDGDIWNGLGAELYKAINGKDKPWISVIGVAKTKFGLCSDICKAVFRGEATNPLWISSMGKMNQDNAADCIKSMYGDYKIPKLLRLLDQETKK